MRKQWRIEEAYLSSSWNFQFLVFLDWFLSDNSGITHFIDLCLYTDLAVLCRRRLALCLVQVRRCVVSELRFIWERYYYFEWSGRSLTPSYLLLDRCWSDCAIIEIEAESEEYKKTGNDWKMKPKMTCVTQDDISNHTPSDVFNSLIISLLNI